MWPSDAWSCLFRSCHHRRADANGVCLYRGAITSWAYHPRLGDLRADAVEGAQVDPGLGLGRVAWEFYRTVLYVGIWLAGLV